MNVLISQALISLGVMKNTNNIPIEWETIFGEVVAKANHYIAVNNGKGGRLTKDRKIRAYEASFCRQCSIYKDRQINDDFTLYLRVYYRNMAHDLDNSIKTILDCLQMCGAIVDDNKCITIEATKRKDIYQPRVMFAIQPQQSNLFNNLNP